MSYSIDANLLLYASDAASPHHQAATIFLEGVAGNSDLLFVAYPTVLAYLRISTHPSIFNVPLTPARAMENVLALTALPQVRLISEEPGFLAAYREVTATLVARGNLVPDAHLATILRQHGVRLLLTNDADFRRFDFLTVRNPLQ